jgi:hypothetical protein
MFIGSTIHSETHIYIAQYEWVTVDGLSFWRPPGGGTHLDCVSLQSLPQQAKAGGTPEGFGIFTYASTQTIPNSVYLGTNLKRSLTTLEKGWVRTSLGSSNITSETVLDMLWDLLTKHADPTGENGPKPLMPGADGKIKLYLGGFSLIREEQLDSNHRGRAISVFQSDYKRNREAGIPLETLQKWTGATMQEIYSVKNDFVSRSILPFPYEDDGWREPETIIRDDFNRGDAELGPDWTDDSNDADIVSNRFDVTTAEVISRFVGRSLSSVNQSVRANLTTITVDWSGPIGRKSPTASTYYACFKQGGAGAPVQRFRRVDGTYTQVGSNSADTQIAGELYELRVNGSSIEYWKNGDFVVATTDGNITGNLGTGLVSNSATMTFDNFRASDLGIQKRKGKVGFAR